MLTLFNSYKDLGRISETLLIGQNLFNKNPSNDEVFNAYFDFLCMLADALPSIYERKDFAERAGIVLAFYGENAVLSDDVIENINNQQQRLFDINKKIDEYKKQMDTNQLNDVIRKNSSLLSDIVKLKDRLGFADTQSKMDKVLSDLGIIDSQINKDVMDSKQESLYKTLTKDITDLISVKMREIEYKENVAYNKLAVESFSSAFSQYRSDENKYKNNTQLFKLVSSSLFKYDASRLFNETLIYYNHVYSYIFSKLDDDGKLALTRYSIQCERDLR
jgi:hypothetical protein